MSNNQYNQSGWWESSTAASSRQHDRQETGNSQEWDWNQEWYWNQDWGWNQERDQDHGSADAASGSWEPADLDNAAQEEESSRQESPVPKHGKPGRGCRQRRRQERDEQIHRNLIRGAVNAPVSDAPLQLQITWERMVKSKQGLTESLLPAVLTEVEGYAKAQQTFGRICVEKAAAMAEGRPVPVRLSAVPPPVAPWIVRLPPPRITQSEGLSSSSSVQRGVNDVPFVPKTPPTPPYMRDHQ